jgi:hypothetical protein
MSFASRLRKWYDRHFTDRYTSRGEYEAGLLCSSCGVRTAEMTKKELICFVGLLDDALTRAIKDKEKVNGTTCGN